jgi:hypothetical protein
VSSTSWVIHLIGDDDPLVALFVFKGRLASRIAKVPCATSQGLFTNCRQGVFPEAL